MGGICDTAVADGNFKTLFAATQAAGLVETLNTKGPLLFLPLLMMRLQNCRQEPSKVY